MLGKIDIIGNVMKNIIFLPIVQRYSICTNQFVLRTVLKYYKLIDHKVNYVLNFDFLLQMRVLR